jgi:hypothetical protein
VTLFRDISLLDAVSHLARAAHDTMSPGFFSNMTYAYYYLLRRALALPRVVDLVKEKRSNWQVPQVFLVEITVKERDSQVANKAN